MLGLGVLAPPVSAQKYFLKKYCFLGSSLHLGENWARVTTNLLWVLYIYYYLRLNKLKIMM